MSKEYDNDDPLWLPEGIEPEGMVYAWQSSYAAKDEIERKLYDIVPRDRHPYIYSDNSVPGTISRKGSFLIERKKSVQQAFETIRKEEHERSIRYLYSLSERNWEKDFEKAAHMLCESSDLYLTNLDEPLNISISISKS